MPVSITDVDVFTDPIVAPADSDPADATYVRTIAQGLANRTANLAKRLGGAVGDDEWYYEDFPRARVVLVGPREGHGEDGWGYNLIDRASCSLASHDLFVDLGKHLPSGAVLTSVEALVKPGTTATMALNLYRTALGAAFAAPGDPTDTQVGVTDTTDGSNNYQVLSVGAITETVDRSANNLVVWLAASSGAPSTADSYFGLRLAFNDQGPRND